MVGRTYISFSNSDDMSSPAPKPPVKQLVRPEGMAVDDKDDQRRMLEDGKIKPDEQHIGSQRGDIQAVFSQLPPAGAMGKLPHPSMTMQNMSVPPPPLPGMPLPGQGPPPPLRAMSQEQVSTRRQRWASSASESWYDWNNICVYTFESYSKGHRPQVYNSHSKAWWEYLCFL